MKTKRSNYCNTIIEKAIIFLLIFTPLAFGTVQPWSVSIMEITAFLVFGAWLLNLTFQETVKVNMRTVLFFAAAIICLIMLQLVPLSRSILCALSPSTASLYDQFSGTAATVWKPISIHPDATKDELYKFLAYACIFVVIIHHYQRREQVVPLLRTVVFMGCFLAVFAVAQKLTWNGKLYWIYPVAVSSSRDFIWGPYVNHNHFAGYMEMTIPLALGLLLHSSAKMSTRSQKSFFWRILIEAGKKDGLKVALLSVAVILMSGVLFLSLSRGAVMGFSASMLLFAGMTRTRRSLRKKAGFLFLIGIAVFMSVVAVNWDRIESRFGEIGQKGNILRSNVWEDSIGIVKDFPVVGTGLGTFLNIYPRYQTKNANVFFEHAENDYMEILTDMGIAGFALVVGAATAFFLSVLKAWRARHNRFALAMGAGGVCSCAAIAVHETVDFNVRVPANALTLTVIAALTIAVVHMRKDKFEDADLVQQTRQG